MWTTTNTLIWLSIRSVPSSLALLVALLGGAPVHAGEAPVLRVESSPTGDITLNAHGASIGDVLHSIAATEKFEVVIDERIPRPPVNLTVRTAPVEHVLRQILRSRNHALIYRGDSESLSQVIVLVPSTPSKASVAPYRRGSRGASRR